MREIPDDDPNKRRFRCMVTSAFLFTYVNLLANRDLLTYFVIK